MNICLPKAVGQTPLPVRWISGGTLLFTNDPTSPKPDGWLHDGEGPASRPEKLKVIVVDDEQIIADTLVEILNGEGFDAMSVSNAHSAIELAQSFKPNVVISDVVMPGLNGVEVGIRIRELLPECRIILFSGQAATVDLLKRAREHGHEFEVLAKPIKPKTLISLIQRRTS